MNGHLQMLGHFGIKPEVLKSDYTEQELDDFLDEIRPELPFTPHDFQEKAFKESILGVKQINKMCTSSGKSMTISLIAEFFRRKGKHGLLLVPNINLLTQFKNDIEDYNLKELHDEVHIIGGGQSVKHFDKSLTISTWQSMMRGFTVRELSDVEPEKYKNKIITKKKLTGKFKKVTYADGSINIIPI